jgi:hypothetical protein
VLLPDVGEVVLAYAQASDPLFAGLYADRLLCFVGFVPATILSDSAYLWMHSTDDVARHKVTVGRFARRLVAAALGRYPKLVGHCVDTRWLASLGATFEPDGAAIRFRIGA